MEVVQHPLIKDFPPYSDEPIDYMEVFLKYWNMEPINEGLDNMRSVEYMEGDTLMEQLQPLCLEYYESKDE